MLFSLCVSFTSVDVAVQPCLEVWEWLTKLSILKRCDALDSAAHGGWHELSNLPITMAQSEQCKAADPHKVFDAALPRRDHLVAFLEICQAAAEPFDWQSQIKDACQVSNIVSPQSMDSVFIR